MVSQKLACGPECLECLDHALKAAWGELQPTLIEPAPNPASFLSALSKELIAVASEGVTDPELLKDVAMRRLLARITTQKMQRVWSRPTPFSNRS